MRLHYGTRAYLLSPEERSCYVFRPEPIVATFLHLMVLFFKVLSNHSSKRQFLLLHWRLCSGRFLYADNSRCLILTQNSNQNYLRCYCKIIFVDVREIRWLLKLVVRILRQSVSPVTGTRRVKDHTSASQRPKMWFITIIIQGTSRMCKFIKISFSKIWSENIT